jgi:hypothetical protein
MYSVDGAGHIRSFAEEIIAENDEEAISKAREMKATLCNVRFGRAPDS